MTQTRAAVIVEVFCRAAAPNDVRNSTRNGECHHTLGFQRGPLIFVGTAARKPDRPDGREWIMCPRKDCRTWNVFEAHDE